MDMKKPSTLKTINRRIGRFFVVMNTMISSGIKFPYSYIKINAGVVILPIKDNNIIAIRQYRIPFDEWLLELPAGMIDEGETALEAAHRELREETGYNAECMEPMGYFYPSQGSTDEIISMFVATKLTESDKKLDIGEALATVELSHDELIQCIMNETFLHSGGIITYFKYLEKLRLAKNSHDDCSMGV